MLTLDELNDLYNLDSNLTVEELKLRIENTGTVNHEAEVKYRKTCYIIESIYNHVENGNISNSKARSLVAGLLFKNEN